MRKIPLLAIMVLVLVVAGTAFSEDSEETAGMPPDEMSCYEISYRCTRCATVFMRLSMDDIDLYKCDPADNLKIPDRCNLNSKEWTSGRHDAVQDIPVKVGQLVTPYVKATLADSVEVFNVLLGLATSSDSKLGKSVFERLAREHRVGMAEAGQVFLVRKGAEEDCTYIIISPIDHLHIQLVANKDKWGAAVGSAVPIHRNK